MKKSNPINFRPILGLFVLVTVILIMHGLFEKIEKRREAAQYVNKLESQIANLKEGNQHLERYLEYAKTESFAERRAKEILQRKKEGEMVITLPESERVAFDEMSQSGQSVKDMNNIQKWQHYFFPG